MSNDQAHLENYARDAAQRMAYEMSTLILAKGLTKGHTPRDVKRNLESLKENPKDRLNIDAETDPTYRTIYSDHWEEFNRQFVVILESVIDVINSSESTSQG